MWIPSRKVGPGIRASFTSPSPTRYGLCTSVAGNTQIIMENRQVSVTLPTDSNGYLGRTCPNCKEYFKIKLGTGLKGINTCICPYCNHKATSSEFTTAEQYEYAKSVAIGQVKTELLGQIFRQAKGLEFGKRGDFIHLRVTTPPIPQFPIKYFSEKGLETYVTCDNCKLDFAVYGVFGNCPDCGQINAFTIFNKSLEIAKRLLESIENQADLTSDIKEVSLKSVLNHLVSSFDSLGKELRNKYPSRFPERPRNLFQNIDELDKVLTNQFRIPLTANEKDFKFLKRLFQVRHIFEHNMGVIDDDFIAKVQDSAHLKGKKYRLQGAELSQLMTTLTQTAQRIAEQLSSVQ